ncbi:zf-C3HC4/zf-CCCH zinc finger proteinhypothetical protein [Cryptosporidium ryanae]|uniref:zf-C3HC4/zf-CCCH zinc finger proteinhypothetical protein n=1 Tax=Cryptosporidium ryanae TaxID=515981 RepID=UPI00351A6465|nr:zf-C3HC4/zf-CCCH zinc finger proteinhypothetical protein [Cryptosporidium ryanae]
MFRKRSVNKHKARLVSDDKDECKADLSNKESGFDSDDVDNEFDEKEKAQQCLKTDINKLKSNLLNFSSENSTDNKIQIEMYNGDLGLTISQKVDGTFRRDNYDIINNSDSMMENLEKHNDHNNKKNECKKSIYERCNFDTLESRNPNIRQTIRIDYQHDICKDYKETGYCGFGDTCKFLHDRSDFTSGWKLDREWKLQEKKRQKLDSSSTFCDQKGNFNNKSGKSKFPSYCFICKKKWVLNENCNPVVTLCNHYFCEKCAFNQYTKSSRCFKCDAPTNGTFNVANNILTAIKSGTFDSEGDIEDSGGENKSETECKHTSEILSISESESEMGLNSDLGIQEI